MSKRNTLAYKHIKAIFNVNVALFASTCQDNYLVEQFPRPRFFPKFFSHHCTHALLQPVTHGSPSLPIRVDGQKRCYLGTCGRRKFWKWKEKFAFSNLWYVTCGRALNWLRAGYFGKREVKILEGTSNNRIHEYRICTTLSQNPNKIRWEK